jgi:hypothetical protein
VYPERQGRGKILDFLLDDSAHDGETRSDMDGVSAGWLQRLARAVLGEQAASELPAALAPGIYWLWKGAR